MNINFVYAKFPWILLRWLSCVCINLLSCNLELLVYLDFQGITILLFSVLLLNIHTLFFLLLFPFLFYFMFHL